MIYSYTFRNLFFSIILLLIILPTNAQEVEIQGSGLIKNVKDPVDPQDAVTKAYLDQIIMGFGISLGPTGIQGLLDAGYSPLEIIGQGADTMDFIGLNHEGGIIFYLKTDGTGLVAAPPLWDGMNDPDPAADWGCFGTPIGGADGTAIGTGFQNTIDIEAGCTTGDIAADICANLDLNGFTDWFLPSKDELNEMYIKIGQGANQNVGEFADSYYWSSSEFNANSAWGQNLFDGFQGDDFKFGDSRVRAIRAF